MIPRGGAENPAFHSETVATITVPTPGTPAVNPRHARWSCGQPSIASQAFLARLLPAQCQQFKMRLTRETKLMRQPLLRTIGTVLLACFLYAGSHAAESPNTTRFPSRPFVLLNQQELATLRNDLAHSGWKADLYRTNRGFTVMNSGRGVRPNADLWLKRSIEIPARGGHFHQFFCVDGDRLETPKDQRFAPGPYRCSKCGRQYTGEKYEGALRRMVHTWLSQAALDLALVAAIEHKPEYAAKAAEILSKYAAA